MKRLIFAAIALLAVIASANANERVFGMKGWEGRRFEEDGHYSHCAAEIFSVAGGTHLVLSIRRDDSLGIMVTLPAWRLRPHETMAGQVTIDGKPIADRVEALDETSVRILYFDEEEVASAYQAIASGKVIQVTLPTGRFTFPLKVPDQVLAALSKCNEAAVTAEFNAPEAAGISRQSKAERVDQAEALTYVVNLLSAAGMSGQVYLQPSEYRDILPEYDVVWRNRDGTFGAAALYVNAHRSDLDLASSNIRSGEAAFCDGNFTSGVMRKEQTNSLYRKEMFTSCDTGEKVRETYYVINVTRQGMLMAVGTIALTAGQRQTVEDTGEAIARGAQISF